jgi:23S rRNA-/tRNA-specific pseudouridylate synthase
VPEAGLARQFLHASELAFPHPVGGARVETRAPLPPELEAYLHALD